MAWSCASCKVANYGADRALCCGAQRGARMWMEENIGKRINMERVDEAISFAVARVTSLAAEATTASSTT